MTDLAQDPVPNKLRRTVRNRAAQSVTANALFPLLLVIPGVKAWAALNPEALVAIQGLLNVGLTSLQSWLKKK